MAHNDPDKIAGHNRDGFIELSFSEDKMECKADLYPSRGEGKPLDIDYIEKLLNAREIVIGIDWETVRDAVFSCNTERKKLTGVLFAKGEKPKNEIPAHYELKPGLLEVHKPLEEKGRIDHKQVSPFVLVKKDQRIAKKYDYKPGEEGKDVTGGSVPFGKKDITKLVPGEGTYTDEKGIVRASFSGKLAIEKETFAVTQLLDVKGNIDYHTGHIYFPGDVTISGDIKTGFHVYSGGSITCNGTIEAADILSKKGITAKMGVLGKNKGILRAGTGLSAKFVQHCVVKTRGDVHIQDSLMNCSVKTMGKIVTGDHGKIIGGEVSAIHGIEAFQIGNEAYHHTFVQCGVDFVAQKELEKVKKKHLALYLKQQTVTELMKKKDSPELRKVLEKLKEHVNGLVEKMNTLLEAVTQNEDAEIIVKDTIYPGTAIDICHTDFIIEKPMKKVRFKLEKELGKIVAENL